METGLECTPCGSTFTKRSSLVKHMKTPKHIKNIQDIEATGSRIESTRKCESCGVTFSRPWGLVRHQKTAKHIKNISDLEGVESVAV